MQRTISRALLGLVLLLAACAPQIPAVTADSALPPVPAGEARIFFYRWLEPYETIVPTTVYLNHDPVGFAPVGTAFYRDVRPGQYLVSVDSPGAFPNQFKTVTLSAGEVVYARIASDRAWSTCQFQGSGCYDTLVVNILDPVVARYEMRDLPLIHG